MNGAVAHPYLRRVRKGERWPLGFISASGIAPYGQAVSHWISDGFSFGVVTIDAWRLHGAAWEADTLPLSYSRSNPSLSSL